MKKRLCKVFAFLILLNFVLNAQTPKWNFDDRYRDGLLYLHSLVNYTHTSLDNFNWETNRFQGRGVRMSFGSVEINDLLCDYQAVMNQPLEHGFWFMLNHRYYATQHRQTEDRYLELGFEKRIWQGFSAFFSGNPAFDKEDADLKFGLGLANQKRTQYIRLALCLDDPFYEAKNDKDGLAVLDAMGLNWQIRLPLRGFWIYSEGKFSTGFERQYPNPQKSPALTHHTQQINHCESKLYYEFEGKSLLELSLHYYEFFEEKKFYVLAENYFYQNRIWLHAIRYTWPWTKHQQLRLILRHVIQEAQANGFRNYLYERTEFLPALFYTYQYKKIYGELGYLGSAYEWDYLDQQPPDNYHNRDWTEKVKLGFGYRFNSQSRIELSVSHVLTYWGFGGGNLQFITMF